MACQCQERFNLPAGPSILTKFYPFINTDHKDFITFLSCGLPTVSRQFQPFNGYCQAKAVCSWYFGGWLSYVEKIHFSSVPLCVTLHLLCVIGTTASSRALEASRSPSWGRRRRPRRSWSSRWSVPCASGRTRHVHWKANTCLVVI